MMGGVILAKSYRNAFIRVSEQNLTEQDGAVLYTPSDIEDILQNWSETAGVTYWYIIHPADDEVSCTHYHILIKFRSPMPFDTIKNRFPYGFIENARSMKACIQYMIHLNDKSKVQYSWDDIKTNCKDMTPYKILSPAQQEITLHSVLESIDKGEIREYNQFTKIPIDLWAKHKTRIENALIYYRERVCMDKDRDIKVIFISGIAGIGKTTFAKRLCDNMNLDYCVSSSSNDPLQDYKGEPALILDDLRDDSFKYHDFLKFLDNHTKSTIRSRYHNKAFIGELIIITSTRPINDWYFNKTPEDKHQLYRRVRNWFKFDGERIYVFEYEDRVKRYELKGSAPNPVVMDNQKKKQMFMNMFDSMGVEFTPSTRAEIESMFDKASNSVPEASESEKKARKEYESSLPEPNWDNINKFRIG